MTQKYQVEITCPQDRREHKVVLTGKSLDVFVEAAKNPHITGKQGGALVAALLMISNGKIISAEHYRGDERKDGPNGEPAFQKFSDSGMLIRAERCKGGKLNDGPRGEPAVQQFNGSGMLIRAERCKGGKLNDGPRGEPAVQQFNDSGVLIETERCKDSKRTDGPNGEPAFQQFNDSGVLIRAVHWKDGKLIKELRAEEIEAYLAAQLILAAQERAAKISAIRSSFGGQIRPIGPC
ncbi:MULTISPECIES: hypothetical protein [unclassified Variovorax]|uniref:hypothetical protein n=1 Tax=unclassified Variovorax TaxID=663243 RepID=UPI00076D29B8|nr:MULTISPECIES: hypothetical protein [unclassified Variovorax]KWT91746.1 hypothetical protein APY03_3183 [Variovorax sp. WDL1]PNG53313.1 hypothetical protein CHC06_04660 [Variovorax sp. B2]PNG53885.1 hypothetical protein CHC07_03707 [Variovorax sp. B4]VTV11350.1 hypothetical protein WDL1CHR_02221 [Variovorax sp. WDL1]